MDAPEPLDAADPAAAYRVRLEELNAQAASLDARDGQLSRVRGVTFLIAVGGGLYGLFQPTAMIWAGVGVAALVFLVFVFLHAGVSTKQFERERRVKLCELALERIAGRYRVPDSEAHRRGDDRVDANHPYSGDLDVYGRSSLFEQLNQTQSSGGAELLAAWLREPASVEVIRGRQGAAIELAKLTSLREEMAMAGMRAGKVDHDVTRLLKWAEEPADMAKSGTPLALASIGLVIATMALLVASSLWTGVWTKAWLVGMGVQIAFLMAVRGRVEPILQPVCVKQSPLAKYRELFAIGEHAAFEHEALVELQSRLRADGGASKRIESLERLVGLATVRHNALGIFVADVFLLWDIWLGWLIDRWRARSGREIAGWLNTLSELEALASLGTFAHEHADFAWPELVDDGPCFEAEQLGHPLIPSDERVVNDIELGAKCPALMVTGSNMSGKSTMLRSVGVSAVLAQAGAPVCATSLRMSPLRVYTSMRIGDALDQGASRFFMEVRKLKAVVDATDEAEGDALLFLLDEVLHGTNSRERNIGAKAVVRHLVARGAIGAVSSHDLGLVELEQLTDGAVVNVHFEDHIIGGKMSFDYRMKAGAVSTSNALRLMKAVGIDVVGLDD
jgi:MutS domain V